jgi:suppressor of G2 allele of SKP1
LEDANEVLRLQPDSPAGFLRRGTTLFHLNRFHQAQEAFTQAATLGAKGTEVWLSKCESKLALAAAANEPLSQKVRDSFVQSNVKTTLTLFAKNLIRENVAVRFEPQGVEVNLIMADGSVFSRSWRLFAEIDPEHSSWELTPYKVDINLIKIAPENWDSLTERVAPGCVVKRENVSGDASALAAPYSGKKVAEWEELAQAAKKDEDEEKPEGTAALQKLFQQIYGDADDDTKRAMMKSYQTSGGTVLSTNWKEVKNRDYEKEVQAPSGQEVRKWT